MKKILKKILLIMMFGLLCFSFAYAQTSDTFIILYEDGTIEERKVEEENQIYSFFSVKEVLDVQSQIVTIASEKNVKAVSLNQAIYFEAMPSDININDAWRFEVSHMNDLWDEVTNNDWIDPNVVVAVIDTGIKTDHPDLNILPGVDKTDDVNPDDPTDFSGHGTHVAGTIGARRDLGEDQVVGIAPGVKILPIKVFSDAGTGSIADLSQGLRYAIDADVDIINMSLSYSNYSSVIEALVEEAEAEGILVVAAASNDSNLWLQSETFDQDGDLDTDESDREKVALYYPSAHPTVMAVGSVAYNAASSSLGISDFSNISGLRDGLWSEIDVVAPGSYIYSSHHTNSSMVSVKSGTSMASPHVAGFAALLLSKYPTLTPEEVRIIIRDTAEDPGIIVPEIYNREEIIGQGLIHISKAFNYNPLLDMTLDGVDAFEFIASTTTYNLSLDANQETLNLTLETLTNSEIRLNGGLLDSNATTLDLDMGQNTFLVSATFGPVNTSYEINIYRGAPELLDIEFYDGETKIDMPVDIDNLPQAFWFEEQVSQLKIVPIANAGMNIEIDGDLLTEKTYDLSSDYEVHIKVLDPLDAEIFMERTFKIIQVRQDIELEEIRVNASVLTTPSRNEDLGSLPYGPMTFAFKNYDGGGVISYLVNDGDEIPVNALEDIVVNTAFDTPQKLSVKVSVSDQRYQWYDFTFNRDEGLDIDAFKLEFFDEENALIHEQTSLEDLVYPYQAAFLKVTLTPNYIEAQRAMVINEISKDFDVNIPLEGDGQDLNLTVFNDALGDTSREYGLRLDRQVNKDLVIDLGPKIEGVAVDYYTAFNYDKDILSYFTEVTASVDALTLDLTGLDPRLNLFVKLNDGVYQVYENSYDLLKESTEEDVIYVKATADALQTLPAYEKIYEIHVNYIKDKVLSDLQVKIEGENQITFNQNQLTYDISYTTEMNTVSLQAFNNYGGSALFVSENEDEFLNYTDEDLLSYDLNTLNKLSIKVQNPLGDYDVYSLNFTERPLISESPLNGIVLSGQSLTPGFSKDHYDYGASVSSETDQVIIEIDVESYAKAYTINGQAQDTLTLPLVVGENLISVELLSEDSTPYTYEIILERPQAVVVVPVVPVVPVLPPTPGPVLPPPAPVESTEDEILTVDFEGRDISQVVVSLNRIQDSEELVEINGEDAALFEPEVQKYLESFEGLVEVAFEGIKFQLKKEHFLEHSKGPMLIKVEPLEKEDDLPVYELNVFVENQKVTRLKNPITLEIVLNKRNLNPDYTGVYYFNESQERWNFVGGKLNGNILSFQVRHFSKYKVIEAFKTFDDIANHWSKNSVELLASRGIIRGKSDLSFEPDSSLSIAEFVALVSRVLDLPESSKRSTYINLEPGVWYEQVIKDASASNMLINTFGVTTDFERLITREEMASVLTAAYQYYTGDKIQAELDLLENQAKDHDAINPIFKNAVAITYMNKWVLGDDQGLFNPKSTATRAEASAVIERLLKTLNLL